MQETVSLNSTWDYQAWLTNHLGPMETWTADERRSKFTEFEAHETGLRADLASRKADELRRMAFNFGCLRARDCKKAELVDEIVDAMARQYVPGILTFRSWTMGSGEKAQTMREAVKEHLARLTEEEVARHREKYAQQQAAVAKALTDPQTIDEFRTFLGHFGKEALTPELAERLDEVQAAHRRSQARPAPPPPPISRVGNVEVKEGWHAKEKRKTFVAVFTQHVDAETFNHARELAKDFDGYYSRFRGSGAIPGFQFRTQDVALQFQAALAGDSPAEQSAAEGIHVHGAAADRLEEHATRMEASATEQLDRDRQTNTVRRARMAASIEADARRQLARAATMRRLAESMRQGTSIHLKEVRHGTQLEELESILKQARWTRLRKLNLHSDDLQGEPLGKEDVRYAEFPRPFVHQSTIRDALKVLATRPGSIRISASLQKLMAEASPDEWGWRLDTHFQVAKLQEFVQKAKAAGVKIDDVTRNLAPYRRLMAADIQSPPELRAALREYLTLRRAPQAEDPVVKAERELIGVNLPGFFPTPITIIQRMLDAADVSDGHRVLEPSAGKGDILDAVTMVCPGSERHAIEISSTLRNILELKGHDVVASDFLEYPVEETYDRVLMNPPFENGSDIGHVQKAFRHLRPGGRLVAIMSSGPFFRSDTKATEFRAWLDSVQAQSEELPEGSFQGKDAFRQTGVNTRLVIIEKPLEIHA